MAHPDEDLLRRGYQASSSGDTSTVLAVLRMPRALGTGSPGRANGMNRIARAGRVCHRRLEAGRLVTAAPDLSLVPRSYLSRSTRRADELRRCGRCAYRL